MTRITDRGPGNQTVLNRVDLQDNTADCDEQPVAGQHLGDIGLGRLHRATEGA